MNFINFKIAVQKQFDNLKNHDLFCVEIDRELLYSTYLNSFPEDTNKLFRERTEHDCNCCKNFIRDIGHVVAIVDGELRSIWDVEVGGFYQVVSDAMSEIVKSLPIAGVYKHYQQKVGVDKTHGDREGVIETWNHFYQKLPDKFVISDGTIASFRGRTKTNKTVLETSLSVITLSAAEIVCDLIEQGLYRGKEFKGIVSSFKLLKREYDALTDNKDQYLWLKSVALGEASKIKNTVIGTLLVDISEGVKLDDAVRMFEKKVAPENYKRTSSLISQAQIDKASEKVVELGLEDSLQRRFAVTEDVTVNNVLFANRETKNVMKSVLGGLEPTKRCTAPDLSKVQEVTIETFIGEILPQADNIELMIENNHKSNFMSLLAPVHANAEPLFKWDNAFSWSYNGEVTDSMKERVKAAGGNVQGELRFSIQWNDEDQNRNDLDAHSYEPNRDHISYLNKNNHASSGTLDVDIQNPRGTAVENIIYTNKSKMPVGSYKFTIHNYSGSNGRGYSAEIEFEGRIYSYSGNDVWGRDETLSIATVNLDESGNFTLTESIENNESVQEVWGVNTCKWTKVNMVMNSPNFWDDKEIGNQHLFFILDGCQNPDSARGFYNEFLRSELHKERKVFEVLASKMKASYTDNQLSGLGFSVTNKNSILCKVSGSFNRVVKIKF